MLEKMDAFFNNRLDGYEEHQLNTIEGAREFYPFTASLLPMGEDARVLDLGCGTGLELGYFFAYNPAARVTGIDMAKDMLRVVREKFPDKHLTVTEGSYFDVPFGEDCFDAVVSVESLHHFTREEKLPLYQKVFRALNGGGYFVLTDYFAASDEEESAFRRELLRLRAEQGIQDDAFYHFDTPLTVQHEMEVLRAAGFCQIETVGQWGATRTIRAHKG